METSNLRKNIRPILTTFIFLFFSLYFCIKSYPSPSNPFNGMLGEEKKIGAELQLSIGSEKENEFFYRPRSFTVDHEGYIYILDRGNSRIQCFSSKGKFCYSFGRYGQGPGELSEHTDRIRLLEDGNLYIIDSYHRRIIVFSKKGEFQKSYKLNFFVDDIALMNKTYYLSNLVLEEKYTPIHIMDDLNKIVKSFGESFEPTIGIIKKINSNPIFISIKSEFKRRMFTNLIVNSKEEVIYSQENPYRIVKYNKEGFKLKEVVGDVQFDTYFPLKIYLAEGGFDKKVVPPFSRTYGPIIMEDDTFIVPVLIPDKSVVYLDVFDSKCEQTSRYSIPNIFFDSKKSEGIASIYIDKDYNIYCLVIFEDDFPKLLKYKLIFK